MLFRVVVVLSSSHAVFTCSTGHWALPVWPARGPSSTVCGCDLWAPSWLADWDNVWWGQLMMRSSQLHCALQHLSGFPYRKTKRAKRGQLSSVEIAIRLTAFQFTSWRRSCQRRRRVESTPSHLVWPWVLNSCLLSVRDSALGSVIGEFERI